MAAGKKQILLSNPQNTAKVKENLRLPRTGRLEHISAPGIKRLDGIRESEKWTYTLLCAMLGKCMFQLHLLKHLNLGAVWFILGNSNVNVNESCCYRLQFN